MVGGSRRLRLVQSEYPKPVVASEPGRAESATGLDVWGTSQELQTIEPVLSQHLG